MGTVKGFPLPLVSPSKPEHSPEPSSPCPNCNRNSQRQQLVPRPSQEFPISLEEMNGHMIRTLPPDAPEISSAPSGTLRKSGCLASARRIFQLMGRRTSPPGLPWSPAASASTSPPKACGFSPNAAGRRRLQRDHRPEPGPGVWSNGGPETLPVGTRLHPQTRFSLSLVLLTAMVDMYGKAGDATSARILFDRMPDKDSATWTAMLSGYVKIGCIDQAFELVGLMKEAKVRLNEVTMVSLLALCREAGALELGRWVHAWIGRQGLRQDAVLATALIDMYANCGDVEAASGIFSAAGGGGGGRDVAMWNAMIGGLAMHGRGKKPSDSLARWKRTEWLPITSPASPSSTPAATPGCWDARRGPPADRDDAPAAERRRLGALLAGCKLHRNAALGETAAKRLLELEPGNCGYSVLLSNMYAMARRWGEVAEVRKLLRETGARKSPGFSSIELGGSLHRFTMGDDSHPQSPQIRAMVEEMMRKLTLAGYVPDTSAVLLNVDEEEKETALALHSEKLAIAFGSSARPPPVCGDCHTATKLLSEIYQRDIIVKDRNRFHHFSRGACSCGDYW
ncbi:unnamed protein product [Spirodela intermedia]|uniref:DYW domain-containing protein n=1 Tax=Spirodela intermedia TaxID=51605 RepID=A0A7I8IEG8_SPIIN|nr:unnamed protein product [Spirodela intermedia]CAA6655493.1 unnamed protein product [Spirodela intermedia]